VLQRYLFYDELIKEACSSNSMDYRYLEHTTDAFIEVKGNSLEEAFEKAGVAVVDTMVDIKSVEEKSCREIELKGKDLNNLLYSWLEELIIVTITDGFVGRRFSVSITKNREYLLIAKIRGEEIDFKKHNFKLEIKSPTFHLMEIKENKPVVMRFLLDL